MASVISYFDLDPSCLDNYCMISVLYLLAIPTYPSCPLWMVPRMDRLVDFFFTTID